MILFESRRLTHLQMVVVLALGILLPFPGGAQAKDEDQKGMGWFVPQGTPAKNFYFGARVAYDKSNFPDSNQDGSVSGVSTDTTGTGVGLFAGYQFNDYVAVEGGYRDFGKSDFRGTSSGGPSWSAGPVSATNEVKAWELGVWGRWPIAPRWYALGYLGWSKWDSKETFVEGTFVSVEENSGGDVAFAIGLEYDVGLKDRFVYRFTGANHKVDDSGYRVNSLAAELVYRFP
jgi:OOP family OmpA-OmpF porin